MKKPTIKILSLAFLLVFSGCTPTDNSDNLSINSSSETISEESSELLPLNDPDVAGLVRSEAWPTEALNNYLSYDQNMETIILTSEAHFHHGLVNDDLFYRVLTRVRNSVAFSQYMTELTEYYGFNFSPEEGTSDYYGVSYYDDVQLYIGYQESNGNKEVYFDFFDGEGDKYKGPVAVDGLALVELRDKTALSSISATRGVWIVRPVTMSVYANNSGYSVGGQNNEHISKPLRIYAGQSVVFKSGEGYSIKSMKILAASGYADETLDGSFTNADMAQEGDDFVVVTPTTKTDTMTFSIPQMTGYSQTKWLEVKVYIEK